jgi:hypothetical protein
MGLLNTVKREKDGVKESTRSFSKNQENYVAKKFGGDRVKNSGATAFAKGDVNLDKQSFLIECKTKTSPSESISIKKEWLEKNVKEALFMGKKYSALAFNFGPNEKNYYIIDEYLFELLLDKLDKD